MQYIEIDKLTPAAYNPRYIDNDKLNKLEQSIKENGFLMPVIVNKSNNVIIAGHQRSKAAKKLECKKCRAITLKISTSLMKLCLTSCIMEAMLISIYTENI